MRATTTRALALLSLASAVAPARAADPLPSWNDGPAKKAILDFVGRVTKEGSPDFVPVADRIATFDNDGTLWCEHPMYVQMAFVIDRVKALAPRHPHWKETHPFKAILAGDLEAIASAGEGALVDLLKETHAGMTPDEFEQIVRDWLATSRHPRFHRPYTELVYQPMLELLAYLRANGFKTFIVSGGGVEFMRSRVAAIYGVPPERVVGSSIKLKYTLRDRQPVVLRLPEINFVDDKGGKPAGIQSHIGRRPVMAFGNSDGDYEMLRWTTAGPGPRFGLIVHHTDAEREYAYDRKTHFGRLVRALDEAPKWGWTVVDMKNDWKVVFPFQK
jgi:phosphoserine phosphatase